MTTELKKDFSESDLLKQLDKSLDKALEEFNNTMNSLFAYPAVDFASIKANGDCKKMQEIITSAASDFDNKNSEFIKKIVHV